MSAKLQQNLAAFSGRILLIVFLVASLAMVTVYFREGPDGPLHAAQSVVSGLVAPFRFVGGAVEAGTNEIGSAVDNASATEEDIQALRDYNKELIDEIAQLEEYRQEAQRLEALLGIQGSNDIETVGARVTGRSSNAWEQIIHIDRGSSSGVLVGMPVMGPSGVVGQIIEVSPVSSKVRLLTDPLSGVAVLIQSNRAEGVVYGSPEGLLYLEDIGVDTPVQIGDVIITSGLGGSYYRGLTVGLVVKIDENQGGSTRKIVVAPNENVTAFEEVLVVTGMKSEGAAISYEDVGPADGGSQDNTGNQDGSSES